MFAVIAVAALGIDVAGWYQKHHQAQVAADAASLAAANCLANAPDNPCTSTTDTTDAAQVATTIALDNGVTIPTSSVTFNLSAGTVSVQDSVTSSSLFAGIVGIHGSTQSAKAVAAFKEGAAETTTTTTTTEAPAACSSDCGAIFAGGTCPTYGATLSSISGTINGSVISDGTLSLSSISGTISSTNYGSSSDGCSGSSVTTSSISGNIGGTPQQLSSYVPYPEDWRAGGNETAPACTYTAGGTMPAGVTTSGNNITISSLSSSIPPGVYCAPNGTISLSSYSGGTSYVTFIAQTITFSSVSGGPLKPCVASALSSCPSSNVLLLWQTGSGTMNLGSISGTIDGTVFAPSATIEISSLSGGTGFIEGEGVTASSISGYVGNGPSGIASGSGGGTVTETTTTPASAPTDSLVQ